MMSRSFVPLILVTFVGCASPVDRVFKARTHEELRAFLAETPNGCLESPPDEEVCKAIELATQRLGEGVAEEAWRLDTEEAYLRAIAQVPRDSAARRVFQDRIAELAFARAENANTEQSWKEFLSLYSVQDERSDLLQRPADAALIDDARAAYHAVRFASEIALTSTTESIVWDHDPETGAEVPGWAVKTTVTNKSAFDVASLDLQVRSVDATGRTVRREAFPVVASLIEPDTFPFQDRRDVPRSTRVSGASRCEGSVSDCDWVRRRSAENPVVYWDTASAPKDLDMRSDMRVYVDPRPYRAPDLDELPRPTPLRPGESVTVVYRSDMRPDAWADGNTVRIQRVTLACAQSGPASPSESCRFVE